MVLLKLYLLKDWSHQWHYGIETVVCEAGLNYAIMIMSVVRQVLTVEGLCYLLYMIDNVYLSFTATI